MAENVRMAFEHGLRRLMRSAGLDLHRHRPEASEAGRLASMLAAHDIDLVFDVGANTGQFAQSLRRSGYAGRIVSFEPLSTAHTRLLQASQGDAKWDIAPRAAIGDYEGEIEIHVAGNSVSSSVLAMLDSHASAAPDSAYMASERVRLSRLDTMARDYLVNNAVSFLKIDTQGYEDRVLDGAACLLNQVSGLQMELSLVPLYEDQKLFDTLLERLRALEFSIWAIWPGFHDPSSGRMLQVDVVFFRD
jgi:FkbM family methyltransferase